MADEQQRSGMPGDGAGRRDEVGGSGVYPASGPLPEGDLPVRGQQGWGQGASGPAGYDESGSSELSPPERSGNLDEAGAFSSAATGTTSIDDADRPADPDAAETEAGWMTPELESGE